MCARSAVSLSVFYFMLSACQPTIWEPNPQRPASSGWGSDTTGATQPVPVTSSGEGDTGNATVTTAADDGAETNGFVDDSGDPGSDEIECDAWSVDDCPEGFKCMPVALEVGSNAWDSSVCRPIMGDAGESEPCHSLGVLDGLDTCASGYMCWDPDPTTQVGMCVEMCSGTPDNAECSEGKLCNSDKNGIINLCLSTCSPLADDCPIGCICTQASSTTAFWCATQWDSQEAGGQCNNDVECSSGLKCMSDWMVACEDVPPGEPNKDGCCANYCDLAAETPCEGVSEFCIPLYDQTNEDLDPLAVGVGVCVTSLGGG